MRYFGGESREMLTHFPDGKDDVSLHDQAERVWVRWRVAGTRATKAGDLKNGRDGEGAQFSVELEDCLIACGLRSECLIMDDAHTLGGETMFPRVD